MLLKIRLDFVECDARMFWPRFGMLYLWIHGICFPDLCCISCFWLQTPSSVAQQTSLSPFLLVGNLGNSNPNPKEHVWGNFQQNWTNTINSAIPFPFGGWGCCIILGIQLGNTPSIPWFSMIYFPWFWGDLMVMSAFQALDTHLHLRFMSGVLLNFCVCSYSRSVLLR